MGVSISCTTTGPATLPILPAWPSWQLQQEKSVLASCDTNTECVTDLWVRHFFEVMLELLNNTRV